MPTLFADTAIAAYLPAKARNGAEHAYAWIGRQLGYGTIVLVLVSPPSVPTIICGP
jgi:hypothetical protein